MPNRYLREAYVASPRIHAASPDARDCWVRLVLKADDHGRYYGSPQLVASNCFPLQPNADRCAQLLAELARVQLIVRYEVAGKLYIEIAQWQERARSRSKFPAPAEGSLTALSDGPELTLRAISEKSEVIQPCAQPPTSENNCEQLPTIARVLRLTPSTSTTPSPSARRRIEFDPEKGWSGVSDADKAGWTEAYPAIDVDRELAGSREWAKAHPENRKSNWRRFLVGWFQRAQNGARPVRTASGGEERRKWD